MTQELIAFDARRLAADLPRVVAGRARERGNRLDLEIDALPAVAWYRSDPTLIQRVLLNLLSNAVKFTENGIVKLRAREVDDGRRLRFEVADTGIGIPLEARERLFAAFTQVDSSISRRFGGTGLGLAICKKIVQGLGGEIGVDSALGVGSLFWFELPVTRAEPAAPRIEELEAPEQRLPRLRILVVEDHAINRQVAGKLLGMLGQEVIFAEDGGAGVAAAAKDTYDLILMDMQMPVMDGIAATRAIREAGCTVPIVAMTANTSDDDHRRCAEAGMTGFEPKPISLKRLRLLISQHARGHRPAPVEAIAAAPPSKSIPVWDEARVAELVQAVGADGHRDLTEMFLSESRAMLDAVRAAVLARDPDAMDRILHTIKGAASNIGLAGVVKIVQDCRSGCNADDPEGRIAAEIARISETKTRIAA
jgi:CheY-like chemotaxis protein